MRRQAEAAQLAAAAKRLAEVAGDCSLNELSDLDDDDSDEDED